MIKFMATTIPNEEVFAKTLGIETFPYLIRICQHRVTQHQIMCDVGLHVHVHSYMFLTGSGILFKIYLQFIKFTFTDFKEKLISNNEVLFTLKFSSFVHGLYALVWNHTLQPPHTHTQKFLMTKVPNQGQPQANTCTVS